MAKMPLTKSEEYELVNKDRDIRGWTVQDHLGNILGKVQELIVDTGKERITDVLLDNGMEYPIREIELADNHVLLGANTELLPVPAQLSGGAEGAATAPAFNSKGELRLQVIEERLRVGKREVEKGGVRVSTEVTDLPAQADVKLREEHVDVVRRLVDRAATPADLAMVKDGAIDVVEKAEIPMVSKEARVVEEVVVKRDVTERTEAVQDTVRHTDVEVKDIKATTPDRPL